MALIVRLAGADTQLATSDLPVTDLAYMCLKLATLTMTVLMLKPSNTMQSEICQDALARCNKWIPKSLADYMGGTESNH